MPRIDLEFTGKDVSAGRTIDDLQAEVERLKKLVEDLSGEPFDIETDPAVKELKELEAELRRLERAFDRAEKSVDFKRAQNELERTERSARQLSQAQLRLATTGKQLIDFTKRLPPELRKSAGGMDRLERQTEQAEAAFRKFQATARTTGRGFTQLVSSVNALKAGLGGLVAALGVQQIVRFGRAIVDLGGRALETKTQFDRLIPGLRAFTGSTELAEEVAGNLARTADRLKVPLAQLINPFLGISSGGREAGLAIGEINDLFEQSLVSARAFGKGADEVQRLLTGISQVAGKGVASMEEFRQQIGEAIPNAIPALAKGLGVTVPEAIDKISSGSLDSATALRALTDGFRELNSEAAEGQLDTVAGSMGAFARESEKAADALADGFAPGLRVAIEALIEFGEGNEDLIRQLGEVAGAIFENVGRYTELADAALKITRASEPLGNQLLAFADGLGAAVQASTGIQGIGDAISGIGDALTGTTQDAKAAFDELQKEADILVFGFEQTAEEMLESFKKSFREQAKAAGAAADDIEAIEKTLADDIGKIVEANQEKREAIERARIAARRGTAEEIKAIENALRAELTRIRRQEVAEALELLPERAEAAKRATEAAIAAEAEAAAERAKFLDETLAKAKQVAAGRVATDQEAADKIAKIEAELAEKILEARQKADEELQKQGAKREQIAQELVDKIVQLNRDAADKVVAELKRIADEAEKAAERRIKAEEKARKALEKSLDVIRELTDKLKEASEGEGEEGGAFDKIRQSVEDTTDALGELSEEFEHLSDPGTLGEDPLDKLNNAFKRARGLLGAVSDDFEFFRGREQEVSDATVQLAEDLDAKLLAALRELGTGGGEAFSQLSQGAQDAVLRMVDSFTEIAESGETTQADIDRFVQNLQDIFGDLGTSLDSPAEQLKAKAEEIADSQEQIPEKAEEAAERTKVAWDPVSKTLESVEEAAGGAAESLGQVADEAERLPEEIIGEEQPERVRELGAAASEAAPALADVAEPVEQVATSAAALTDSLPIIAALLPEITTQATALLAALAENPVDLETLGENMASLTSGLEGLRDQLGGLTELVAALPDPLAAVLDAITPLLEQVGIAAEDDRLGRLAASAQELATGTEAAVVPLEAAREALDGIADRGPDVQDAIDGATDRLRRLGGEATIAAVDALTESLEAANEQIDVVDGLTKSILSTIEGLNRELPETSDQFDKLATAAQKMAVQIGLAADVLDRFSQRAEIARKAVAELGAEFEFMTRLAVSRLTEVNKKLREMLDLIRANIDAAIDLGNAMNGIVGPP